MTLLSELIDGASGIDEPVSSLLRKVKVIASRVGTGELEEWVEHELVGYPSEALLPAYRGPFRTEVLGHFGGYFGSGLRNAPIPPVGFPKEFRTGSLFNIEFRQPIAEIEELSTATQPLQAFWPADALAYANQLIQNGEVRLYQDMGLQQAWQVMSPAHLRGIVDTVRTRILNLALSLEKITPEAGQPNAAGPSADQMRQIVTNVYGGSPNIAVASSDFSQSVQLPAKGDREKLLTFLSDVGVIQQDLDELRNLLAQDAEEENHRKRVTDWLGRLMIKSSGTIGLGAAADLIARAVAAYLGLS